MSFDPAFFQSSPVYIAPDVYRAPQREPPPVVKTSKRKPKRAKKKAKR